MDSTTFGQQNFNLPHDVVTLPSKGLYYKPKKESLKVGYLTATDENVLMGASSNGDGIIYTLLRQKIYEPGFNINGMLDCDVQAVLIFLRNTSFGPEYSFTLKDPVTGKDFDIDILLDELNFIDPIHQPDEDGFFSCQLPKTSANVKCRLLTIGDQKELDKLEESYPKGMIAPVVTKRLEKQIVELNGKSDFKEIATFVSQLPIADSKFLRNFINECQPKIDLERVVIAPSGERVTVNVAFGAEFFRPFF